MKSSAVKGNAVKGNAVKSSAVKNSVVQSKAVSNGATGGRAVASGAVGGGAVASGAVGGGAAGGGARGGDMMSGRAARWTALAGATLAFGGLVIAHAAPGVTALRPVRRRFFPRLAGLGHADHVALTFDDGPDPEWTPAFLETLATWRVRATFFMLGSMAAKAPGLAAEVAGAGHEVGVHGWEHRYTVLRGPRALRDDIARAKDAVAAASGAEPRFYRPPYGVLSAGALAAAHGLGLTPVLWTCSGREWTAGATPGSVYASLTSDLSGGTTVLLHDSDCTSPAGACAAALGALPRLLEECAGRGLRVGTVAEHGLGA